MPAKYLHQYHPLSVQVLINVVGALPQSTAGIFEPDSLGLLKAPSEEFGGALHGSADAAVQLGRLQTHQCSHDDGARITGYTRYID